MITSKVDYVKSIWWVRLKDSELPCVSQENFKRGARLALTRLGLLIYPAEWSIAEQVQFKY